MAEGWSRCASMELALKRMMDAGISEMEAIKIRGMDSRHDH
jgi:hypothetical protein